MSFRRRGRKDSLANFKLDENQTIKGHDERSNMKVAQFKIDNYDKKSLHPVSVLMDKAASLV